MGTERVWMLVASVLGFLGVALGAFGAHGLRAAFEAAPERLSWWGTGTQYHLIHALAVGLVAFLHTRGGGVVANGAGWAFSLGVLLFSGSLYGLGLGGPRWFGMVTPLGGILLLLGWVLVGVAASRV